MQMWKIPAFLIGPYKPKYSEDLKPSKGLLKFPSMDVFIVYQADINLPVPLPVCSEESLSLSKPNQLVF